MKKFLVAAIVAATAVSALSACKVDDTSAGADGKKQERSAGSSSGGEREDYTVAQENAIEAAQQYVDMSSFSRAGLVQQLTAKVADGYKMSDAVFAVDHVKVDWNKEAVEAAKTYLEMSSFSRDGLVQQLTSKAGDQFTPAQAQYAVKQVGL